MPVRPRPYRPLPALVALLLFLAGFAPAVQQTCALMAQMAETRTCHDTPPPCHEADPAADVPAEDHVPCCELSPASVTPASIAPAPPETALFLAAVAQAPVLIAPAPVQAWPDPAPPQRPPGPIRLLFASLLL